MRTVFRIPTLLAACGLLTAADFAAAQNALGDGRGLEREMGNAPRPTRTFRDELNLRNAIVTGNAPGGASFRGDVGYRAPGEFTGSLGSNDLFSFRRDTALSSAVATGRIRGNDAIRYQFEYAGGGGVDREFNPLIIRDGAGSATRGSLSDEFRPGRGTRSNTFQTLPGSGTLRSTSAFEVGRALSPTSVGRQLLSDGNTRSVTASGLRGVIYTTDAPDSSREDRRRSNELVERISDPSRAPERAPGTERAVERARTSYDDLRERLDRQTGARDAEGDADARGSDASNPDNATPNRDASPGTDNAPGLRSNPSDPARSPSDPSVATPGSSGRGRPSGPESRDGQIDWKDRLAEIRRALREQDQKESTAAGKSGTPGKASGTDPLRATGRDAEDRAAPSGRISSDTFNAIRAAGVSVDNLISPLRDDSDRRDVFARHMRSGQTALAAGRYFDAEEQFAHARELRDADPSAMVGRLHAQLGAGMYRSAAINLRQIATDHPETLGMTYRGVLLPQPERLDSIKSDLSELIQPASPEKLDLAMKREAGLLLAYLGFQQGDTALVERGLRAMQTTAERVGANDDALGQLLRGVWIGDQAAQPLPAETK